MWFLLLRDENRDAAVFRATFSRVVVRDRMLIAVPFGLHPTGIYAEPLQLVAHRLGSSLRELLVDVGVTRVVGIPADLHMGSRICLEDHRDIPQLVAGI